MYRYMIQFDNNHYFISQNQTFWSWEYNSFTINAFFLLEKDTNKLILYLKKSHLKTGLGKGTFHTDLGKFDVGTLKKPKKREVISILSKFKFYDKPFPRSGWHTNEKYGMNLSESIDNFKNNKFIQRSLKLNKIKNHIQ